MGFPSRKDLVSQIVFEHCLEDLHICSVDYLGTVREFHSNLFDCHTSIIAYANESHHIQHGHSRLPDTARLSDYVPDQRFLSELSAGRSGL